MTVKELIEKLEIFDPTLTVVTLATENTVEPIELVIGDGNGNVIVA